MTVKLLDFGQALTIADTYGKIAHLFVSLYGDLSSKANQTIRANVDHIVGLRPQAYPALKVDYFDAASAKVWG